jgi:spore photoproduct lyase
MTSINRLYIDRRSEEDALTGRIRKALPDAGITIVGGPEDIPESEAGRRDTLFLTHHPGAFVKDFPTVPGSPPCGEKYILTMLNCPFSCTYCYLQSYLEHRRITIFTNTARLESEIRSALSSAPAPRLTTGEMGDSLALDHITGTTAGLLPLFEGTDTILEVRTKSAQVEHLMGNSGRLVVTWTLGPEEAIRREEPGTASLTERLGAVSAVARSGVRVGIRFDPVIPAYYTSEEYMALIDRIADTVPEDALYRFELGVLRFPPGLRDIIRRSHPGSRLLLGEYIRDRQGKLRLYRPKRIGIYRDIHRSINARFPNVPVEISMEDLSVWEDAGVPVEACT